MYKVLLIETGEYLYHHKGSVRLAIYSSFEISAYNINHFTDIFTWNQINNFFYTNSFVYIDSKHHINVNLENKAFFDIIDIGDNHVI